MRPYEIVEAKNLKIGVISMMGPDFRRRDKELEKEKYANNLAELPRALKAFADAGVEIGVILHHEYPAVAANLDPLKQREQVENKRRERALECAKFCADERKKNPKIPAIQLIVILTDEPEPPALLKSLDPKLPTQTIEIGHKGKYVGLIGVYKDGKGYRLQHQNVLMSPDWLSKPVEEKDNPVIALMEKYNQQLKQVAMLDQYPRSPHSNQLPAQGQKGLRATYVGSESCKKCHEHAFKVWDKTEHSFATKTLEGAVQPAGRQYDPECMKCHTTGFKHPGGYNDPITDLVNWPAAPGAKPGAGMLQQHNKDLRGVGCESCHGPASEHVKNPGNKVLQAQINPYRPTDAERKLEGQPNNPQFQQLFNTRMRALGTFCMKCHDLENDVNWPLDTADRWIKKRIVHRTPLNNNGGVGVAPPAAKGGEDPPLVIEVFEEEVRPRSPSPQGRGE